jgi:hypothetical protein
LPFERDGIAVREIGSEVRSYPEFLGLAVEGRQKELGPVLDLRNIKPKMLLDRVSKA